MTDLFIIFCVAVIVTMAVIFSQRRHVPSSTRVVPPGLKRRRRLGMSADAGFVYLGGSNESVLHPSASADAGSNSSTWADPGCSSLSDSGGFSSDGGGFSSDGGGGGSCGGGDGGCG